MGKEKINWKLNPVLTIYPESVLSKPSSLPTLTGFRKSPKPCIYQPDQVDSFVEKDKIHNIEDITEKHCSFGYTWHKTKDFIMLYVLLFDDCSGFPTICKAIKIDNSLHIELQYCNNQFLSLISFCKEEIQNLPDFLCWKIYQFI